MEDLSTSPGALSEFADLALSQVVEAMRPGWLVLRNCVLSTSDRAIPTCVQYALLHPRMGITLLDVVPGTTAPRAAEHLKQRLDAIGFSAKYGRNPPILYFCVPLRALPDVGRLLAQEFAQQPPSALPNGDAWVTTAQAILSAQPMETPAFQVPAVVTSDRFSQRRSPNSGRIAYGRRPGRRSAGARLLAGFWGLVAVSLGGGAMFLQYLGPPAECAHSASAVDVPFASAAGALPGTPCALHQAGTAIDAARAPASFAEADAPLGIVDAEAQRALIENERAVVELQERLRRFEHAPETDLETSSIAPGTLQELPPALTAVRQELDSSSAALPTPGEMIATPPARPSQLTRAAIVSGPRLASLQTATAPVTSDGSSPEGAPAETPSQPDAASQAPAYRDEGAGPLNSLPLNSAPLNPEDDVAATQSPPAPASAAMPAQPTELPITVPPHEPSGATAPSFAKPGPPPATHGISPAMVDIMLRRADAMLRRGDVSAARLLYDRIIAAGFGRAATAMGKTFDTAFLIGIGVTGVATDPALAASWYHRGLDLGDEEARVRLQSLFVPASSNTAQEKRP